MNISEWIEDNWLISQEVQLKIAYSLLVIVGVWLFRFFGLKLVFRSVKNPKERYYWRNGIKNLSNALLLIIIGSIWIDRVGSLATFFGLVGAGLAIALQDPIVNVAGWVFILLRRPFEVGDRIEIGGFAGDVIDIRFYQFTLNEIKNWVDADQSTGRIIHIPNGRVFKEPQASYTQGFSHIWNEIEVRVTFESNWKKAKAILEDTVNLHAEPLSRAAAQRLLEASKQYLIFYTNLTPIVYTKVKENGVALTMRYLCDPRKRRTTEHKIWEDILTTFAQNQDIDFAYPTQRIYYNAREGKEGARKNDNDFNDRMRE
uniref:Mechanosensitive ion channel n=1 Tax=Roseihalotalea indica TaxID=2867963 RepID=A0AA49JEY4_9BACT|nr:mechanosensitive ion channel [Tunicatimonas sp. TK19036]